MKVDFYGMKPRKGKEGPEIEDYRSKDDDCFGANLAHAGLPLISLAALALEIVFLFMPRARSLALPELMATALALLPVMQWAVNKSESWALDVIGCQAAFWVNTSGHLRATITPRSAAGGSADDLLQEKLVAHLRQQHTVVSEAIIVLPLGGWRSRQGKLYGRDQPQHFIFWKAELVGTESMWLIDQEDNKFWLSIEDVLLILGADHGDYLRLSYMLKGFAKQIGAQDEQKKELGVIKKKVLEMCVALEETIGDIEATGIECRSRKLKKVRLGVIKKLLWFLPQGDSRRPVYQQMLDKGRGINVAPRNSGG